MQSPRIFLVCTHVIRRPCCCRKQNQNAFCIIKEPNSHESFSLLFGTPTWPPMTSGAKTAWHPLSLVVSFVRSNKGHLNGFVCVVFVIGTPLIIIQWIPFSINAGRSQKTRKWLNSGKINPLLLEGLTFKTSGHFSPLLLVLLVLYIKAQGPHAI